jgi:hypothetical protein
MKRIGRHWEHDLPDDVFSSNEEVEELCYAVSCNSRRTTSIAY